LQSIIDCSLLGAEQGDTLQLPVDLGLHADGQVVVLVLVAVLGGVGAQPHSRDEVLIVTLWVLVDGAAVVSSLGVELLLATTTGGGTGVVRSGGSRLGGEMNHGEGLEWILRGLVFEALLVSGPGSTFKVETVDADTFTWDLEYLLDATIFASNDFLLDFSLGLNGLKRPLLLGVLSSDLLHGGGQETLRVVEASQPE